MWPTKRLDVINEGLPCLINMTKNVDVHILFDKFCKFRLVDHNIAN